MEPQVATNTAGIAILFKELEDVRGDIDGHHHATYTPDGKANVIMVRHSELDTGSKKKNVNVPLSKVGQQRAYNLGKKLAATGTINSVDRAVATRALRNKKTAILALDEYEKQKCSRSKDCATSRYFKLKRGMKASDLRLGLQVGKKGSDLVVLDGNQICEFMDAAKVPSADISAYCSSGSRWIDDTEYGAVFWFCNGDQCNPHLSSIPLANDWTLYLNVAPDGTSLEYDNLP